MTGKPWALQEVRHVVPVDDLRLHDLSPSCWCRPREETPGETGWLYVHRAADMREESELVATTRVLTS